jgi:hypothetical protein
MSGPGLYFTVPQGSGAPSFFAFPLAPLVPVAGGLPLDMTTVTGVTFEVLRPNGTRVYNWTGSIAPGATVGAAVGLYALAGTEFDALGTWVVKPFALVAGGSVPCQPAQVLVTVGTMPAAPAVVPAPPGYPTLTVATTTALGQVNTLAYPAGAMAYVISDKSYWTLDPTSVATPDGSTVIAALGGGGNWLIILKAITQLTGDVEAGPGTGSVPSYIGMITGPGGVPGLVPVNPASALVLGATGGTGAPAAGAVRFRDSGGGQTYAAWRTASGVDLAMLSVDGVSLTLGDPSGARTFYQSAVYHNFATYTESPNSPHFGGAFSYNELGANPIATFYQDGWSVMWEQGSCQGKDGIASRFNYWNTNELGAAVVAQIVFPTPAYPDPCKTLLAKLIIDFMGWEIGSATGEGCAFTLEVSLLILRGTPVVLVPMTIGLNGIAPVDKGHTTSAVGVTPTFVDLADGYLSIQATPWTANQIRWQAFVRYAIVSDQGNDLAPAPVW